jgi:NAD(P)-dependent dehydrogenase (short-subunit alcohol dehydrogenase family)
VSWGPEGKTAVVTGASSGIGEATARRLVRAGVTVVAVARRRDRLETLAEELATARGRLVAHEADVTDTADVDALADRVRDEFGACHILVNNAGVGGGAFDGRDDLEDALRTLDVNLLGTVRCLAAFADLLEESAPSRVVNIASVAGKLGIGPAAYAASKFGVVGLSEALSLSWAPRGITVCQLNPGFIVTEGFPQTHLTGGPMAGLVGEPDDVAERVVEVLRTGVTERTVPSWYRPLVTLRHLAPPVYRAVVRRIDRAGGERGYEAP